MKKALTLLLAGVTSLSLALSANADDYITPVSYTHLTLPTKRIV